MRNILEPRVAFKPFEYPELQSYVDGIQSTYWIHSEIDFSKDLHEYKTVLSETEKYIALVEQAAVVMGLHEAAEFIRGRDLIWFEDNAVVLGGLVKGANHGYDLDSGAAAIQLVLARLHTRPWWEYVESEANWADGASRLLEKDTFLYQQGFQVHRVSVPAWPWVASPDARVDHVKRIFRQ